MNIANSCFFFPILVKWESPSGISLPDLFQFFLAWLLDLNIPKSTRILNTSVSLGIKVHSSEPKSLSKNLLSRLSDSTTRFLLILSEKKLPLNKCESSKTSFSSRICISSPYVPLRIAVTYSISIPRCSSLKIVLPLINLTLNSLILFLLIFSHLLYYSILSGNFVKFILIKTDVLCFFVKL